MDKSPVSNKLDSMYSTCGKEEKITLIALACMH